MKPIKWGRTLLGVLALLSFLLSCQLTAAPANERANEAAEPVAVQDNLESLAQHITLPFPPETALWTITPLGNSSARSAPGPTDYRLDAVLTFSPADLDKLRAEAVADAVNGEIVWQESSFASWYPDSVKQSFSHDEESASYTFNGSAYDAAALFGKSPYLNGRFFITPDSIVFLTLFTS